MALSEWDKQHLTREQQQAIEVYTSQWERAHAAGDEDGMRMAHEGAEAIRARAGYSGGSGGYEYLPTAMQTTKTTRTTSAGKTTYQTATVGKGYDNGSLSNGDVKTLQGALGVTQDGYFGPKTQAAAFQKWGTSTADDAMRAYQTTRAVTAWADATPLNDRQNLTKPVKTTAQETTTNEQTDRAVLGGRNPAAIQQRQERKTEAVTRYETAKDAYSQYENERVRNDPAQMYGLTDAERAEQFGKTEQLRKEYEDARHALEMMGVDPENPDKLPGLGERLKNIATGGIKSTLSQDAEAAAILNLAAGPGNDLTRQSLAETGNAFGDGFWGTLARQLINNPSSGNASTDTVRKAVQALDDDVAPQLYQAADKLSDSAAADISRAQEGASELGRLAINTGIAGVQMAGDLVMGGGNAMVPMMIRSFGGGAQEARQKGYSTEQQLALGLSSAATEWATEKLFGGNPIYDNSDAGLVNRAISAALQKFKGTDAAARVMSVLASPVAETLNEGWEEVASDLITPLWEKIITGHRDEIELQQLVEDWIVGVLMGSMSQAGSRVIDRVTGPSQSLRTTVEPSQSLRDSSPMGGAKMEDDGLPRGLYAEPAVTETDVARTDAPGVGNLTPVQNAGAETQKNASGEAGLRYRFIDGGDVAGKDAAVNEAYERVSSRDGGVVISDELLAKYDAINKNPAMKLIDAVKDFYEEHLKGQKVDVRLNDGIIEVKFENDGKKKSVGWRMKTDKAASFEQLLDLTRNAEYAYSEVNRDTNEATSVPRFHYFIGDALIGAHVAEDGSTVGGVHMPVKIQVRDIITDVGAQESRYYTHNLEKSKAGSDSPVAGAKGANIDSNAYTPALTKDTIAQESESVKSSEADDGAPRGLVDPLAELPSQSLRASSPSGGAKGEDGAPRGLYAEPDVTETDVSEERKAAFLRAEQIAKRFGARVEIASIENGASGMYRDGVVTIAPNETDPVMAVLVHELTHHMETSGRYGDFADAVLDYIARETDVDIGTMKRAIRQDYEKAGVTLDDAGAEREIVAKFAESKLFTDEAAINRLARENRSLFEIIRDWIRDMAVKLTGTDEERFIRKAERLYEKALRSAGETADTGEARYSISETDDGKPVAVVDSDILSQIDTTTWDKAKREEAKKAAKTALLGFKDGIPYNGVRYTVNHDSRNEYTRSNETDKLFRTNKDAFADKMRAAANVDDVIKATSDWTQDGELSHGRNDSFIDFERGKVLLQAGNNQYIGETIIGITRDGRRVFYDVVDINPTTFTTRRTPLPTSRGEKPVNAIQGSPSGSYDTTSGENVNREIEPLPLPSIEADEAMDDGNIEKEDSPQRITRKSGSKALGRESSNAYDTTSAQNVNREIEDDGAPRGLYAEPEVVTEDDGLPHGLVDPLAEYSLGGSFDELVDEARSIDFLSEAEVETLLERVQGGDFNNRSYIPLRKDTPQILIQAINEFAARHPEAKMRVGHAEDRAIVSEVGHLRQTMDEEAGSYTPGKKPHGIEPYEMLEILRRMDDPVYIVLQKNGRFAEVVRYKNKGGKTIIAALDFGENKNPEYMNSYEGGSYNVIVTTYSPTNLNSYLNNCQAIVFDKTKDTPQRGSGRVEWPSHLSGISSDFYDTTSVQDVNREIEDDGAPRGLYAEPEVVTEDDGLPHGLVDPLAEYSLGGSFDELAEMARYSNAEEEIEEWRLQSLAHEDDVRIAAEDEAAARLEREGKNLEYEDYRRAVRERIEASKKKTGKAWQNSPSKAKAHLRHELVSVFGIPNGSKATFAEQINAIADEMLSSGRITGKNRLDMIRALYDAGVASIAPQAEYSDLRQALRGKRVYVNESVRADLGDNWNDLRKRAMANGFYLVTDPGKGVGVNSVASELADRFGFAIDEDADGATQLEQMVTAAERGKRELISLSEEADMMEKQYGPGMREEQINNLERQFDEAVRRFAEKAKLELELKEHADERVERKYQSTRDHYQKIMDSMRQRQAERLEREKQAWRDAFAKNDEARKQREAAAQTLRNLKRLRKRIGMNDTRLAEAMEYLSPEEQKLAREALGNLCADAQRLTQKAKEKLEKEKALYDRMVEENPNYIPDKKTLAMLERLDQRYLKDMTSEELMDLHRALQTLEKHLSDMNKAIGNRMQEQFDVLYKLSRGDIEGSKGRGKTTAVSRFMNEEQLTPMNYLEMLGGWKRNNAWFNAVAKELEEGERARKQFIVEANNMVKDFREEHTDWIAKSDGQGKNAIWYDIKVPRLMEYGEGNQPIFGESVTVHLTPAMRVELARGVRNNDNLRHAEGGVTFPDKKLYSEGRRAEAYERGTTVRLAPETMKTLFAYENLTAEEKELFDLMDTFFDGKAKQAINETSQTMDGVDRAMSTHYSKIYTNKNYRNTDLTKWDESIGGMGSIQRRVFSRNPMLAMSVWEAFDDTVDTVGKYHGLAIPTRNVNMLLNWRDSNGGSMKDAIAQKWGGDAVKYVEKLVAALQNPSARDRSGIDAVTGKLLNNYVTATFGMNPGIVLKQFSSFPAAAAVLGVENVPSPNQIRKADPALIAKYTPELEYRSMGYATPELAELKNNPNWTQRNKTTRFLFGGAIQGMDRFTVKAMWPWAENYVRKSFGNLEPGSDAFYRKTAEVFNEAVGLTQPMYDVMHRPAIMRDASDISRAFTMFKTVPMQQQNMLRRAVGEAQNATGRQKTEANRKLARTVSSVVVSNLLFELIEFANQAWKNAAKKYRDDDDELTAWSAGEMIAKNALGDLAGMFLGGDEAIDAVDLLRGKKSSYFAGMETPGLSQLEDLFGALSSAVGTFGKTASDTADIKENGGSLSEYVRDNGGQLLGAVKDLAESMAVYLGGIPVSNIEKYLLGTLRTLSPRLEQEYKTLFDKTTKRDLSGLSGEALDVRVDKLIDNRLDGVSDLAKGELARLYESTGMEIIPSDIPTGLTVDGEKLALSASQEQTYRGAYRDAIGDTLNKMLTSDAYRALDDEERAKTIAGLYNYAKDTAKCAVTGAELDSSTKKAQKADEMGLEPDRYFVVKTQIGALDELEGDEKSEAKLQLLHDLPKVEWSAAYYAFMAGDKEKGLLDGSRDAEEMAGTLMQLREDSWLEGDEKTKARCDTLLLSGLSEQEKRDAWLDTSGLSAASRADRVELFDALKDVGIGFDDWLRFTYDTAGLSSDKDANGKDIKGRRKQDKVWDVIDGYDLTDKQKDALHLAAGYKESSLANAPWNDENAPRMLPTA